MMKQEKTMKGKEEIRHGTKPGETSTDAPQKTKAQLKAERRALQVNRQYLVFTPTHPCVFWPCRHKFRDIELNFRFFYTCDTL